MAASGYGLLCFLLNRSIYYPMKYPQGLWEFQTQVGASEVWLRGSDGVRVHGWLVAPREAHFTTLFLHGNAGNLTHRVNHIQQITSAGSSILVIDYRGYGKSEGRPSEKGLYRDAEAAYQYLVSAGHKPERIVLHGESLGTAVAVALAARRSCGGLVLEAPFTSGRDVAARALPVLGPILTWGWDSKRAIAMVRAPVLVIHGTRDEVIPFDLGRKLFEAAGQPKWFWAVDGSGHNDILETAGTRYRERLEAFYAALP